MSENVKRIKIFEYALNQEKTGMSFFRNSLERMGVGAAVSAFKRLIAEEEKHIDFITRILADLKASGEINGENLQETTVEATNFFDERAKREFLEQCVEGSMMPDVTVFNTAWLIEKDLSEYYGKMAAQTDGDAARALKMLSNWEKEHEKFFREYRDKLSDVYAQMPWGG
ncbi:MAG: ferritin family protein [Desulfomonile sp.]